MEPIRSDRSRLSDRRRTSSRAGSSGESGLFARHLDQAEATSAADSSADVGEPAALDTSALPSMDAPTTALFDAVHAAGQRLADERTFTAAQLYREAVRRFMRSILPDASSVEVHESNRGILNRKRYVLVTSINAAVDRLVSGLMHTQREQIDTLARLEEIQGMLVDLVH